MERLNVYGLPDSLMNEIRALAERHGVERVILFGSRARGDFRRTSDIDLAVSGGRSAPSGRSAPGGNIAAFALDVDEETNTLLRYDVVNLDGAVQPELRDAIDREGKIIYEKV